MNTVTILEHPGIGICIVVRRDGDFCTMSIVASNHFCGRESLDVSVYLAVYLSGVNVRYAPYHKYLHITEISISKSKLTQNDPFGFAILGLHSCWIELCCPRFFQFSRSVEEYSHGEIPLS